ncbi:CBL-interacting serine/threonine-protein kinase 15-like [Cryptomeria japonica]|uniref:CBL-interacting serine/threonine-protein kinase 15-like n=1 Tax=Cryptomeria japonica TaxID=3369 RepID=UPI0027DA4E0E|nr:CBL-interacting serine/threonine-protein kinase 15-like [Cryptomeria japonica]
MERGQILMGKYEIEKLIGEGEWGKVYRAVHTKTGDTVAIKLLDKKKLFTQSLRQIEKEISNMRSLRHPNIVQLYEVMATKTKIYLIMEYVSGGDFFAKLEGVGSFGEEEARKYFQQLISAVDFCHSRGVFHRDLKLENLLVDGDGNLKVADFGLSTLKKEGGKLHGMCGTPQYIAPEVYTSVFGYDGAKADVWMCGVILYLFLEGRYPFDNKNDGGFFRRLSFQKRDLRFDMPWFLSEKVQELVAKVLDPNPKTRFSTRQIMEHSWFRKNFQAVNENTENSIEKFNGKFKHKSSNAFEIISSSFDISPLIIGDDEERENSILSFTSNEPIISIVKKLGKTGKEWKLTTTKTHCTMNLKRKEADKKRNMENKVMINEVGPSLFKIEDKLNQRHIKRVEQLQPYTFSIKYKKGVSNKVEDALSRRALTVEEI